MVKTIKQLEKEFLAYLNSFKSDKFYFDKNAKKTTIKSGNYYKRHNRVLYDRDFNKWLLDKSNKTSIQKLKS